MSNATNVDVASDVVAFAELCADLDDRFADRHRSLTARRLDEDAFRQVRATWLPRLAVDEVRRQFEQIYRARRAWLQAQRSEAAARSAPPISAQATAYASVDATTTAVPALEPALPFVGHAWAASVAPAPSIDALRSLAGKGVPKPAPDLNQTLPLVDGGVAPVREEEP